MSANTSCNDSAAELLRQCVERESWDPHLARSLAAPACSDALFRILFEGLADRFEPQLCDNYAAIFAFILNQPDLIERYRRIRQPRLCTLDPNRVVVLSRVTLGADIAITSVILDAVRQRFPNARITFAGSAKAAELFHGMQAVDHVDIPYARQGSISDRLASLHHLREQFDREDTIVIDPDSRLTQLGLLPVNDESRYFFFESRAYGRERSANLTELTQQWVLEALGVTQATNRIYPPVADTQQWGRYAAVSLGTANNPAKQLPPDIESALIRLLSDRFDNVIVDRGFGPEESARVDRRHRRQHLRNEGDSMVGIVRPLRFGHPQQCLLRGLR